MMDWIRGEVRGAVGSVLQLALQRRSILQSGKMLCQFLRLSSYLWPFIEAQHHKVCR